MKTSIILHGHFYQPPRENPETGIIPLHPEARPFKNWNYKILRECYRANAFSRHLTYDGRISNITNNYEYLSYNFGPTLLNWLAQYDQETYQKIISADAESIKRMNGHGNAVAQAFNHTILPLDNPEVSETQIVWGISNFQSHFNRYPEGFWLPEAAINQKVIDMLIRSNIAYVILSPWQADSIQYDDGKTLHLNGKPAPSNEVFRLEGSSGSIAAFFYQPDLASGISFGHFLTDADKLFSRVKELSAMPGTSGLLHTATDGEIYGHHEPFGDMCLAALIHKVEADQSLEFSNYGAYLESHPPIGTAELKSGESDLGSSWSCAHGVSRWYKDCGCSTGGEPGWNQKWRTPLREAFNCLYTLLNGIFNREMKKLGFDNPLSIMHAFEPVISNKLSAMQFVSTLPAALDHADEKKVMCLLEGQKFAQYMFTSCGWFFSDISGIEPKQNIRYAIHAISIYEPFLDKESLLIKLGNDLSKAVSNQKNKISGKTHVENILRELSGYDTAASYWVFQSIFSHSFQQDRYGQFELISLRKADSNTYTLSIKHIVLLEEISCIVTTSLTPEKEYYLTIQKNIPGTILTRICFGDLPTNLQNQIELWIKENLISCNTIPCEKHILFAYAIVSIAMYKSQKNNLQDSVLNQEVITAITGILSKIDISNLKNVSFEMQFLEYLTKFMMNYGTQEDCQTIAQLITVFLNSCFIELESHWENGIAIYLNAVMKIVGEQSVPVDFTRYQEKTLQLVKSVTDVSEEKRELLETMMQKMMVLDTLL